MQKMNPTSIFFFWLIACLLLQANQAISEVFQAGQVTGYQYPDGSNVPASLCGSYNILGGYGAKSSRVWSKTYEFPNGATSFILDFYALFIDSWNGESVFVEVDGVQKVNSYYTFTEASQNYCGDETVFDLEKYYYFSWELPCAINEVTVTIYSNLDEDDVNESLGIFNLNINSWSRCESGCRCCEQGTLSFICQECSESGIESGTCDQDELPVLLHSEIADGEDWGSSTSDFCNGETVIGGWGILENDDSISRTFEFEDEYKEFLVLYDAYFYFTDYQYLSSYANGIKLKDTYYYTGTQIYCASTALYIEQMKAVHGGISQNCPSNSLEVKFKQNKDSTYYYGGSSGYAWGVKNIRIYAYKLADFEKTCRVDKEFGVHLNYAEVFFLSLFDFFSASAVILLSGKLLKRVCIKLKAKCCKCKCKFRCCKKRRRAESSVEARRMPNQAELDEQGRREAEQANNWNNILPPLRIYNNDLGQPANNNAANDNNNAGANNNADDSHRVPNASNAQASNMRRNSEDHIDNSVHENNRLGPHIEIQVQSNPRLSHSESSASNRNQNNIALPPIDINKPVEEEKKKEEKNQSQAFKLNCVVCMAKVRNAVFFPCMHFSCCDECARKIQDNRGLCPICRKKITGFSEVYVS